ncbi:MAG: magnesium and cobalt transport protein CorA [Zoogloeaceae bacterium]|jgi:magnesium transporter|nr:magnesium and cobalt transport protein CorA [Zoogloeaceae bacterium]
MLLFSCIHQSGGKLSDAPLAAVPAYLRHPGCFVWAVFSEPDAAELAQAAALFDLPALVVEDIAAGEARPKFEEYGAALFIVMRSLARSKEQPDGVLHVFASEHSIVAFTRNAAPLAQEARKRCAADPALLNRLGPALALYALIDTVVDHYFPVVDALQTNADRVESHLFGLTGKGHARRHVETLYAMKRRATRIQHAAAPLMEVTGKLYGGRVPLICRGAQEYFRDVHDHLIRINGALDTLRETLNAIVQAQLSLAAIEQGDIARKLAAWGAIFATATAFAGIWGMNFQHMPELDLTWGYPMALGLIAGVCGILYYRFKKAGWL